MTTVVTDPISGVGRAYVSNSGGAPVIPCLMKGEWAAAIALRGLLRDNANITGLTNTQIAALAVARGNAALIAAGAIAADHCAYDGIGGLPLSLYETYVLSALEGLQADHLNIATILAIPGTPADDLISPAAAGNVEHIVPPASAATVALQGAGAGSVDYIDNPTAATAALAGGGAGNVENGAHLYKVTYVDANGGETAAGTASGTVTVIDKTTNGQVSLSAIPTSANTNVVSRIIYRTLAGGSTYKLLTTIANNTATTYTDNTADASLGATAPSANTAGAHYYKVVYGTTNGKTTPGTASAAIISTAADGRVALTVVPVSSAASVTYRNLYRTKAGAAVGGTYYLVAASTINNNTGTTYNDNIADSALGAAAPSTNDAALYKYKVTFTSFTGEGLPSSASAGVVVADKAVNGKVTVSSIATGPSGTTSRKVYRTVANGSVYKLVGTVTGNVTTTFTDNIADADLGATAPSSDTGTAGLLAAAATAKATALIAGLPTTNTYLSPVRLVVLATGAQQLLSATKGDFFAECAMDGYLSDSLNIGAQDDATLAAAFKDLRDKLVIALNA